MHTLVDLVASSRLCWKSHYAKQKILALNPKSSLQGGGNRSHTSLIQLVEEFADDEVDVVTSRFPQLTSVSREKVYYPPSAHTIQCRTCNTFDGIHIYELGVIESNV
jgi:hypothetical protein